MTSQRSVTVEPINFINEERRLIATVRDHIPLGFALAYLFPPNPTQVKRGAVSTSAPVLHKDVELGWAKVSTARGAMDRLSKAANRLYRLDQLLAEEAPIELAFMAGHPDDFQLVDNTFIVFGTQLELRGGTRVALSQRRSAVRAGEELVLITEYFARAHTPA